MTEEEIQEAINHYLSQNPKCSREYARSVVLMFKESEKILSNLLNKSSTQSVYECKTTHQRA